jgi:hypothetical protein
MYDELVKRLRDAAKMSEALAVLLPHSEGNATAKLYNEAADAIDAKQNLIDAQLDIIKQYQQYLSKHRWIPVVKRLPYSKNETYWVCTDTGYQCECRWTNNRFGLGESDRWGWSLMDTPQFQKIVAWRPLPEPYEPTEEE